MVTHAGLDAYVRLLVQECKAGADLSKEYECFYTLDERVAFTLTVERPTWSTTMFVIGVGPVESDNRLLPDYAFKYARTDFEDPWLEIVVADPPTPEQIDVLLRHIRRLQLLRPCGCGKPFALPSDMCPACTLTLTGVGGKDCLVCFQPVPPPHQRLLACCGQVMHKGCHSLLRSPNCPHCRACLDCAEHHGGH